VLPIFRLCERVRVLAKTLSSNEQLRLTYEKEGQRIERPAPSIPLDSTSKWNSTLFMLDALNVAEQTLTAVFLEHAARFPPDAVLAAPDFALARQVVGVLRPLYLETELLQGDGMAGSSLLPSLAALATDHAAGTPVDVAARGSKDALEAVEEADLLPEAREFRAAMRQELLANQRHLQASRETLLRATLLDPRYKNAASAVVPFATEAERDGAVEALLREAGDLLRGREGPEPPPSAESQPSARDVLAGRRPRSLPGMEQLLARRAAAQPAAPQPAGRKDLKNRVAQAWRAYLALPQPDRASDPLAWWAGHVRPKAGSPTSVGHVLGPLARKYLAIPGTNGGVERLWSSARRLLNYDKGQMDTAQVARTLMLRANAEELGLWPLDPIAGV
jgi:hypothetical protein